MYSAEKNIQILLALLKANGIRKIIASPGTTNHTFVGSVQNDPYFQVYSSVDERSAAYIACGMAAESCEPVVLSCTGSTASRNYYPGLTEAYYRKLPILAITSHHGNDRIGQLIPQIIDRRVIANDVANLTVDLPVVNDYRDEAYVTMETNKAILELYRNGGGPVHINIFTTNSKDFSITELPQVRTIRRYHAWDKLPELIKGKIAIFIGSHCKFTASQNEAIDNFCATYDAIVICDHTSGYYGKYRLLPTLAYMQKNATFPLESLDLIINIGEVSAAVFYNSIPTKEVWRVSEDGELRDPYKKLTCVFQMSEEFFFRSYSISSESPKHSFIDYCNSIFDSIYDSIPELPFSNIWAAQQLSSKLPHNSLLHLSASNTRRCWNMFHLPEGVESTSNVGCCGIDGCTSSMLGASLANPNKICFGITGDLAFFYDINVLGNRHIPNNLRIMLINNGVGAEFCMYNHPCKLAFGEDTKTYIAAAGHFGRQSQTLVKHFAEDLGYTYISAKNKQEFIDNLHLFTNHSQLDKPIIFELFIRQEDESDALNLMTNIDADIKQIARNRIKNMATDFVGESGIRKIKNFFKK